MLARRGREGKGATTTGYVSVAFPSNNSGGCARTTINTKNAERNNKFDGASMVVVTHLRM